MFKGLFHVTTRVRGEAAAIVIAPVRDAPARRAERAERARPAWLVRSVTTQVRGVAAAIVTTFLTDSPARRAVASGASEASLAVEEYCTPFVTGNGSRPKAE